MERRLAAILAADVVGYSGLMEADEVGTLAALKGLRQKLIDPQIAKHNGRTVKLMGDGALVEFASVVDAVACALAIQSGLNARNEGVHEDRRISLRIGVHLGDIMVEGDDLYGDGVNIAARLEGLAEPGSICISQQAFDQVETKLDISCEDLGEQQVKNIVRPVRVYRVSRADDAIDAQASAAARKPFPEKPSLAVLPFDNLSGDPGQEFLADGFTEEIITVLARYRSLRVIARNSVFSYKRQARDVRMTAKELGVRYIVEGSLRRAGERIRVTVQLIDAESGDHIWADRFDRQLKDVFAIQDEIAQTISAAVVPEISHVEQERAHRKPPQKLSAWERYHRGLWHLYHFSLDEVLKAQKQFRHAIEIDPEFAAGHAGLAYALLQETMYSDTEERRTILENGIRSAQVAISLDTRDALAHFVAGRIWLKIGEYDAARSECEQAVDLNPSFAYAHFGLGDAQMHLLKFEEAIECFRSAIRLSPRDPHAWTFVHYQAWPLLGLKRYQEAVEIERQALHDPNATHWPYIPLISALGHLKRRDEAKRDIEQLHRIEPGYNCARARRQMSLSAAFAEHVIDGLRKAGLPE